MTSQCVCCEKCSYQGPGTGSLLLHRAFPAIMSDWLLWKRSFKRLLQLWTAAILHNLYRLKRQRLLGSKVFLKRNLKSHSCILSSTLNMSPNCPTHLAWVQTVDCSWSVTVTWNSVLSVWKMTGQMNTKQVVLMKFCSISENQRVINLPWLVCVYAPCCRGDVNIALAAAESSVSAGYNHCQMVFGLHLLSASQVCAGVALVWTQADVRFRRIHWSLGIG